jgi:hypothetical protein
MTPDALRIKWSSIVIASVSIWVLSVVLVTVTISAYAFSLGWASRGAPDSAAIQRFADSVGPVWGPRLSAILTGLAAIWLGRRVNARPIWHGVLIGVVVVGTPLAVRQRFGIESILPIAVTLLAGAVGGWLGSRIKDNRAGR